VPVLFGGPFHPINYYKYLILYVYLNKIISLGGMAEGGGNGKMANE
jgi:hypothetical protein